MSTRYLRLFLIVSIIFSGTTVFSQAAGSISVTPPSQSINPGQSATVRIVTAGVDKCTITGEPYNNFDIIKTGNILLRPTKTTTYTFNCKNTAGNTVATARATITIVPVGTTTPPPGTTRPPTPSPTPRPTTPPSSSNNQNQYSNQSLLVKANEMCAKYSGYTSVFPPVTAGAGGSAVPVDLTDLRPYLISIDRWTQLTANEMRQQNLISYCDEYINMANASKKLGETAAQNLKTFADNCYGDKQCMMRRAYKSDLETEIKFACQEGGLYNQEICKLVQNVDKNSGGSETSDDLEMRKYCDTMYEKGFYARECYSVPKAYGTIVESYYQAKERLALGQQEVEKTFNPDGIAGSRPCLATASGKAPSEVRFYEADCIRYREEPSAVNEEALRQITALPYTQAFSPSSVLSYDPVLDNINTRVREGSLVDPNISPTLGSTGGGSGSGNNNPPPSGVDLRALEANYKKLVSNVTVVIQLFDTARLAYSSSTSVCKNLPVSTRNQVVTKIEQNKKSYVDYLAALKKLWDAAIARPRENHTNLIVKINFDLKDKHNQQEIDQVYTTVKKLIQTCVDAKPPTPTPNPPTS